MKRTAICAIAVLIGLMPVSVSADTLGDTLIKGESTSTVYYLAEDGQRYVFPNQKVYSTWFDGFASVAEVSDAELASYPIGGNVTYRPGAKLIKIQSDPKTYAVDKGGVIRWVSSESLAANLYGDDWNTKIDDVPDSFFVNYTLGKPILSPGDYSPTQVMVAVPTVAVDKGLSHRPIGTPSSSPAASGSSGPAVGPTPPASTPPVPEVPPVGPTPPASTPPVLEVPPVGPTPPASTPPVPEVPPGPPASVPPVSPEVPETPVLESIVQDDFSSYSIGSVVGQGGWSSYTNGDNFLVASVAETSMLYIDSVADSVITKAGTSLADGRQAFVLKTADNELWGDYGDGNAQVRVTDGPWGVRFLAMSLKEDGNVAYYDTAIDKYVDFATYNDGEWVRLEMEWRSSDSVARYRADEGEWTEWMAFRGSDSFSTFSHVGIDFVLPDGGGGLYVKELD